MRCYTTLSRSSSVLVDLLDDSEDLCGQGRFGVCTGISLSIFHTRYILALAEWCYYLGRLVVVLVVIYSLQGSSSILSINMFVRLPVRLGSGET